ncbi:hypothetical protein D3C78_1615120 [compost metagenome]
MAHLEGHTQRRALGTAVLDPVIGDRLQTVVDMDGGDRRQFLPLAQARQQMQKDGGVQPAGKGDFPRRRMAPGLEDMQETGFERHRTVSGRYNRRT